MPFVTVSRLSDGLLFPWKVSAEKLRIVNMQANMMFVWRLTLDSRAYLLRLMMTSSTRRHMTSL